MCGKYPIIQELCETILLIRLFGRALHSHQKKGVILSSGSDEIEFSPGPSVRETVSIESKYIVGEEMGEEVIARWSDLHICIRTLSKVAKLKQIRKEEKWSLLQ